MRNWTEHGFSRLTAISDAGSTPAASTINLGPISVLKRWARIVFEKVSEVRLGPRFWSREDYGY